MGTGPRPRRRRVPADGSRCYTATPRRQRRPSAGRGGELGQRQPGGQDSVRTANPVMFAPANSARPCGVTPLNFRRDNRRITQPDDPPPPPAGPAPYERCAHTCVGQQAGELGVDELDGGVGVVEADAEQFGVLGGGGLQAAEPLVQGLDGLAGMAFALGCCSACRAISCAALRAVSAAMPECVLYGDDGAPASRPGDVRPAAVRLVRRRGCSQILGGRRATRNVVCRVRPPRSGPALSTREPAPRRVSGRRGPAGLS